jgi:hypothetical protein
VTFAYGGQAVPEVYVNYLQLRSYGNPWSRVHLGTMMGAGLFPPSVSLSANRVAWRKSEIEQFLATRPPSGAPPPQLWPKRQRPAPKVERAKPVGRPRGSKIVAGPDGRRRLVRLEESAADDAAA